MTKYSGSCVCEAVQFEVEGPVLGAQVCHCSVCRRAQGSSLGMLAAFFQKDNLKITAGEDNLEKFHSPLKYSRKFCKKCGTRIGITFEDVTAFEVNSVAIYPTHLADVREGGPLPDEFKPQRHIYYADRLYDFNDDVPKFKDMPKEFGGSGQLLDNSGAEIS